MTFFLADAVSEIFALTEAPFTTGVPTLSAPPRHRQGGPRPSTRSLPTAGGKHLALELLSAETRTVCLRSDDGDMLVSEIACGNRNLHTL